MRCPLASQSECAAQLLPPVPLSLPPPPCNPVSRLLPGPWTHLGCCPGPCPRLDTVPRCPLQSCSAPGPSRLLSHFGSPTPQVFPFGPPCCLPCPQQEPHLFIQAGTESRAPSRVASQSVLLEGLHDHSFSITGTSSWFHLCKSQLVLGGLDTAGMAQPAPPAECPPALTGCPCWPRVSLTAEGACGRVGVPGGGQGLQGLWLASAVETHSDPQGSLGVRAQQAVTRDLCCPSSALAHVSGNGSYPPLSTPGSGLGHSVWGAQCGQHPRKHPSWWAPLGLLSSNPGAQPLLRPGGPGVE